MFNIFNMLSFFEESTGTEKPTTSWTSWLIIGAIIVLMIVMMIVPQRKNKKKAEEIKAKVVVGATLTTIGGIVGEVVAVDDKGFTLLTGSGDNKTTMTFVSGAVYMVNDGNQTATTEEKKEETDEIK